ncbi:MAG: penicillin-binding protein 2 [Gammaproteobacteria bacterium]|nr:penicillin-binding protein 2 [Gammaproteobacteria bacterium]MDH5652428.1 penicillin-binding protein 2 [Gammaproteobacteria bacterium]
MAQFDNFTFKDHLRESLLFNRRLTITIAAVVLLTIVLIGRLFILQVVEYTHYTTLSEKNRVNIVPIPPTRGLIYDRNGVLLAHNVPTFLLEVVEEHVENVDTMLGQLKQIISLTDSDITRFKRQLNRKRKFESVPLRYRLTEEEVARISVNQFRIPGVYIKAELARHYPQGKVTAHVAGYVGRISELDLRRMDNSSQYRASSHTGKVGVERTYEKLLHGQIGLQRVESNAQGRIINVLERTLPVPGKTLYLNIDSRLHAIAEKAFGEDNGAAIAIDPNTGAVLALVSVPSYDPNQFIHGLDTEAFDVLKKSPNRPLFNRAVQGQYPPGSTLKPLLGLAGLELDEVQAFNPVNCKGWMTVPDDIDQRRYRDWKRSGHGTTNLVKAITESCDIYFYDLAYKLGIDRIYQYLSAFGLGKKTGIDVIGELVGLVPNKDWKLRTYNELWFPGETLINGIGQGYTLSTPLQLASFTATLSKFGQRMQPIILKSTQDPKTLEMQPIEPVPLQEVHKISDKNWRTVIHGMEKVVHDHNGTARGIGYGIKYRMAGKTGTAQVFGIKEGERYDEDKIAKKLRDHALFIAFAPADDPKIAVAVIVENGGGGGTTAAPIARKIIDYYLLGESHEPKPTL